MCVNVYVYGIKVNIQAPLGIVTTFVPYLLFALF